MTCRSSSNSIINSLELEKARLRRAHPDWSDEQLRQVFSHRNEHVLSYLMEHAETPRSLQQDLANGPGIELTYDGSWGPTDLDLSTIDFDHSNGLAPVPMARHSLSTPSYPGSSFDPSPTSRSLRGSSTGSKRDHHQIDMAFSASYTYGSDPSCHTDSSTAVHGLEAVQSYEPAEYMMKLSSDIDCGAESSISKRQRLDGVRDAVPYAIATNHNLNSSFDVTPNSSMSTTLLCPCAPALGEPMSRKSNMTNSSLISGVDMLSLGSFSSVASGLPSVISVEDLERPLFSCSTENATDERSPNTPFLKGSDPHSFCFSDEGSTKFPFFAVGQSFPNDIKNERHSIQPNNASSDDTSAEEMQRSDSDQSMTSTTSTTSSTSTFSASSAEQKGITRRRKHIENGRQAIAMKSQPSGSKTTPLNGNHEARRIKAAESAGKRKEAIAKAPYVRPTHPKLFCDQCNKYPDGFKGDHELRRHRDRAHATHRKVWICTEPAVRTDSWPESPLNICKYCRNRKTFNVDYNAAAHLRRVHFFPCKRGRKPRGDPRESRAGKAGGDTPSIEWLKENGWLTEVEVTGSLPDDYLPKSEPLPELGSFPSADLGIEYSADTLGFGPAVMHDHEDDLDFSSSQYGVPQQYGTYCSGGADGAPTAYPQTPLIG